MGKHLTLSERISIQSELDKGISLSAIAKKLGKDRSTIAREIRKHRTPFDAGAPYRVKNRCRFRYECKINALCLDKPNCLKKCSTCKFCNSICPEFVEEKCPKLEIAPYVCNGCENLSKCVLKKFLYNGRISDNEYRSTLVEARTGFNLTDQELQSIDDICSPLIKNGQSVYHICINNKDELTISEKSVYRLIHASVLSARAIDAPRICRLKPRKSKPKQLKIDRACRSGRTWDDYCIFIKENPDIAVVEIDTVEGVIGGKVLLTVHFTSCNLMLGILRESNNSASVIAFFKWLWKKLTPDQSEALIPVILTDNGSEFSNPKGIEVDENGIQRSRVFYCEPYSAWQKGHCEVNHEFIRRILPKGSSLDWMTQDDVNLMMAHINSYARAKLGGKSPAQIFADLYGLDLLRLVCPVLIPPEKIILTPALFTMNR